MKQAFINLSLRRKQVLLFVLTSAAALLLACLGFTIYEVVSFRRGMVSHLSTLAEMVGYNSYAAIRFADEAAIQETLSALHAEPDVAGAAVYDTTGKLLASYDRLNDRRQFQPPIEPRPGAHFSADSIGLSHPVFVNGQRVAIVYLDCDNQALYVRLKQYLLIGLAVFAAATMLSFAISAALQRLISNPILELVRTARRVGKERDYSLRVERQSDDEVGALVESFNEMLSQIQSRNEELQSAKILLEQRVAERTGELEHKEELYRRAIVAANAVPYSYNFTSKKYSFVGSGIEQLLGYSPSELCPALWQAIIKEAVMLGETAGMAKHDAAERVKTGEVRKWHCDMRILTKDGRTRWISDISVQQFDEAGKPVGSMGILQDITDRKEADQSLRLLSSAIEHCDAGVIITTKDGVIKYANPAVVQLTGYSREELYNGTPRLFKSDHHAESFYQALWESISAGRPFTAEFVNRKKSGELFYEEKTVTPVTNSSGEITHFVATGRDITRKKKTEAEMENLNRQLIEVSRRAGMAEVASNVLHNVGNVLNSVNVSADLVLEQMRRSKLSNLGRVSELLNQNGEALADFLMRDQRGKQLPGFVAMLAAHLGTERKTVIDEMSSLTKNLEHIKEIVAMQQSYAKVSGVVETIPPADLVEDALRLNLTGLQRHGIELIRDFSPVPLVTVEKHKVLQILVNLIRNAKDAMSQCAGTRRILSLSMRLLDAERLAISISDTGIGIPPENLTRIFNHGFTTKQHGHGFGLHGGALSARELGGCLTVASQGLGRGAIFTLELPCRRTPAGAPRTPRAPVIEAPSAAEAVLNY